MNDDRLIASLSCSDQNGFVERLGTLYEHSPWIASSVWTQRPFPTRAALHAAMQRVVAQAPEAQQLALIRAHPDLAGRLARAGTLEPHSAAEQTGLGLDRLSDADYERFDRANTEYRARFGFPFVIAVRNQTRESVLAAFAHRLGNTPDQERTTALAEIGTIAWLRLQDLA